MASSLVNQNQNFDSEKEKHFIKITNPHHKVIIRVWFTTANEAKEPEWRARIQDLQSEEEKSSLFQRR